MWSARKWLKTRVGEAIDVGYVGYVGFWGIYGEKVSNFLTTIEMLFHSLAMKGRSLTALLCQYYNMTA
jgi:hypothetical protein